jgi:hypothetical protein
MLNIGAMVLLTLLLCGFTVASILKTDLSKLYHGSFTWHEASRADAVRNTFLFHYSLCTEPTARNVNTALHLIGNAVSSAALASSNFFLSGAQLAITCRSGYVARARKISRCWNLSWRNALGLSPFKTVAWIALLVTSLPLHLLFNSAILQSADSTGSHAQDGGNCYVGVSNPLFLTVTLACLVKVIICVMIVWVLGPQESLVTPGDAVASFISVSDSYTADRLELLVKHPKHKADSGSPILWQYTPLR